MPESGAAAWVSGFSAPGVEVLSRDSEAALLWWPEERRLFGVDVATGEALWPSLNVSAELERIEPTEGAGGTEAQRRFVEQLGPDAAARAMLERRIARLGGRLVTRAAVPEPSAVLASSGGDVVVLSDRQGRVLAIDGLSGDVMWRTRTALGSVTGLEASHGLAVVRGLMFPGEDHQSHAAVVLDTTTGQTRLGPLEFNDALLAADVTADGGLVVVSREEASRRSVSDGSLRWRTRLTETGSLLDWALGGEAVMMAWRRENDSSVELMGLDLESGGRLSGPARVTSRSAFAPRLIGLDGGWLMAGPERVFGLEATGELRWADGATLPADAMVLATWHGRDHAVAVYAIPDRTGDATPGHRALTYALATGRIVADVAVDFPPMEAPATVAIARPEALFVGSGDRAVRLALEPVDDALDAASATLSSDDPTPDPSRDPTSPPALPASSPPAPRDSP
jgi:hypothetical protein